MSKPKVVYLQRLYLTIFMALGLAYWPHEDWFIRFLCLLVYGILAAWTEQAAAKIPR